MLLDVALSSSGANREKYNRERVHAFMLAVVHVRILGGCNLKSCNMGWELGKISDQGNDPNESHFLVKCICEESVRRQKNHACMGAILPDTVGSFYNARIFS